jgi:hypothetical protein
VPTEAQGALLPDGPGSESDAAAARRRPRPAAAAAHRGAALPPVRRVRPGAGAVRGLPDARALQRRRRRPAAVPYAATWKLASA